MPDDLKHALFLIADEMRAMAAVGGHYASNPYEAERAERIRDLAVKLISLADADHSIDEIQAGFSKDEVFHASPATGAEAVVFNPVGAVLLIQRRSDGRWALPGGLGEVGRTLSESALLELWEEAGLRGRVVRLLGLFDGQKAGSRSKIHFTHAVFQIHSNDLSPTPGIETTDARFFAANALPELYAGHDKIVPLCFQLQSEAAHFDPASSESGDLPTYQRPLTQK